MAGLRRYFKANVNSSRVRKGAPHFATRPWECLADREREGILHRATDLTQGAVIVHPERLEVEGKLACHPRHQAPEMISLVLQSNRDRPKLGVVGERKLHLAIGRAGEMDVTVIGRLATHHDINSDTNTAPLRIPAVRRLVHLHRLLSRWGIYTKFYKVYQCHRLIYLRFKKVRQN